MKIIECALVYLGMLLVIGSAYAGTIYVDDNNTTGPWNGTVGYPFQYIQDGIDAAVDGDTVLVADGTYIGAGNRDLDFKGKAIIVTSKNGAESTIIDCEGLGRGFHFHSGETSESMVSGFTITNSSAIDGYIGAICCIESSPIIRDNIITGNSAGGIYCNVNAAPVIDSNIISENTTTGSGSGIYCIGSNPIISNNIINANVADGSGGGILCASCSPTITNNRIIGNSAHQGGGIHGFHSHSIISNNEITANTAKDIGGGIFLNYYAHPVLINNTICMNSASNKGGGIYLGGGYPTDATITLNTIIWWNLPEQMHVSASAWIDITYSNIQGGWPGEGNIQVDPLFVDADNNDYHLAEGSPCIATGIMTPDAPDTDIEGNPRPNPPNSNPDMGAYENSVGDKLPPDAPDFSTPTEIIGNDGAPMVLIPAGEFLMGDEEGKDDAKPVHTVYLDAFYMDVYEITNGQYKKFVDATGHRKPTLWNSPATDAFDYPIVGVSWDDAQAYCRWAGKRLPTEAEWEKAARGGLVGKKYTWGDILSHDDANYSGKGGKDQWRYTAPVGSFAPNGYGLYDMAGNVWEWCSDWYDDWQNEGYYARSPQQNPLGPDSGTYRVMRGGGWDNGSEHLTVAYRNGCNYPSNTVQTVGFRCVQYIAETVPPVSMVMEAKQTVDKGNSFFVSINVETVADLAGFQLDVAFDPAILEAVGVEEGTFLSDSGETYWLEPGIDNDAGVIAGIGCAKIDKGGVDGTGTLAIVTFKAIGAGESYIRLQNVSISDANADLIPATVLGGSVIVEEYPSWDVNKDGQIDILDIVLVGQHFGEDVTTPLDPNPDVDGDGVVSIFDLVLVCQHFGESYLSAAPSGDIWSVAPQYLPVLTRLYSIMEGKVSSDPGFMTTRKILHRLISGTRIGETAVFQNYPNPFNPETWIPYQLAEGSEVVIRVYNATGQLVRVIDLGYREAGVYLTRDMAAYWDGTTETGERVSSGVYFYSIAAGNYSATRKMTVVQ